MEDPYGDDVAEEDREKQIDVADLLIRWHREGVPDSTPEANVSSVSLVPQNPGMNHPAVQYRNQVANQVAKYFSPEVMPEVEALIEDFDLIPVSVQHINKQNNEENL